MGGKSGFTFIHTYIYRTVYHGRCGIGSGTTYRRQTTDGCNLRVYNVTMSFVSVMVGGTVCLLGSHPFLRTQIHTLILQHSSSDRPSIPTLPHLRLQTSYLSQHPDKETVRTNNKSVCKMRYIFAFFFPFLSRTLNP